MESTDKTSGRDDAMSRWMVDRISGLSCIATWLLVGGLVVGSICIISVIHEDAISAGVSGFVSAVALGLCIWAFRNVNRDVEKIKSALMRAGYR